MTLTKEKKGEIIKDLKEKISNQKAMIFIDSTGLKVKDLFNLRKELKKSDSELKITRKTLMRIAFKEKNIELDPKNLTGEVAIIFGYKDEITPTKIVYQFSEDNPNLKILGGFLENRFFETEKIIELAKLPFKEELLSRLIADMQAPITNFINVLQGNIKGLIYVLAKAKT